MMISLLNIYVEPLIVGRNSGLKIHVSLGSIPT